MSTDNPILQNRYEFMQLPYTFGALEPAIDALTMEIHYSKHHRAYYDNFLKSIDSASIGELGMTGILMNVSKYPEAVRNNAGGYFNHNLFWENLKPGGTSPGNEISGLIERDFESFENMKVQFNAAASGRFGSGWAWLSLDTGGKLFISSTPNQDNPLMDVAAQRGTPLLALDVWEHAYYLKYQNKRADYVNAFWQIVNWETVDQRFKQTGF